jgi:hypothetical protein
MYNMQYNINIIYNTRYDIYIYKRHLYLYLAFKLHLKVIPRLSYVGGFKNESIICKENLETR